jgi:hypothetical protein
MSLALGWLALVLTAQTSPDSDELPRRLVLEEPRKTAALQEQAQERPQEPVRAPQGDRPIVDLEWLELTPSAGVASYSSKFLSNPGVAMSLRAHAPIPLFSPPGNVVKEYFGVFGQAEFTSIDRDMSHTVPHRRGVASFFSLGLDYTFIRDNTWLLVARAGVMYAYYGGVADLKNGVGPVVGLSAGIQISGSMAIAYTPEMLFGDTGSRIFLNTVGVLIQF